MLSLIPERPLIISPSLATTIGLEEAILLQVLNDAATFGHTTSRKNYQWSTITHQDLIHWLPFWTESTLQRIINSLRDKGIILVDNTTVSTTTLCFAMNEAHQPPTPPITRTNTSPKLNSQPDPVRGATLMHKDWRPDEDLLQLMHLNHNINKEFALAQCEDFVLYWLERHEVSHSWSSKFRQHVLKEWRFHQSRQTQEQSKTLEQNSISNQWKPSHDALEILYRTGITPDFIDDAIPEFVLYWGERGEASSTWNSKFIAHIRRQWAKYTKTLELDYEPRPIAANWQPSEDVYDILKLANIDLTFARQLVPEFVLFWRDTKEIQRSWNTKFLQHSKYQWATRHHMGQHYAAQSVINQSTHRKDQSPFQQLTDRSWAEGIVEDLREQ